MGQGCLASVNGHPLPWMTGECGPIDQAASAGFVLYAPEIQALGIDVHAVAMQVQGPLGAIQMSLVARFEGKQGLSICRRKRPRPAAGDAYLCRCLILGVKAANRSPAAEGCQERWYESKW